MRQAGERRLAGDAVHWTGRDRFMKHKEQEDRGPCLVVRSSRDDELVRRMQSHMANLIVVTNNAMLSMVFPRNAEDELR